MSSTDISVDESEDIPRILEPLATESASSFVGLVSQTQPDSEIQQIAHAVEESCSQLQRLQVSLANFSQSFTESVESCLYALHSLRSKLALYVERTRLSEFFQIWIFWIIQNTGMYGLRNDCLQLSVIFLSKTRQSLLSTTIVCPVWNICCHVREQETKLVYQAVRMRAYISDWWL